MAKLLPILTRRLVTYVSTKPRITRNSRRDMDTKLEEAMEYGTPEFIRGFQFAMELLRNNKFHGHYAEQCANWLEKHLTQEVSSKTTSTKRGY
jgi:hypothetical protein